MATNSTDQIRNSRSSGFDSSEECGGGGFFDEEALIAIAHEDEKRFVAENVSGDAASPSDVANRDSDDDEEEAMKKEEPEEDVDHNGSELEGDKRESKDEDYVEDDEDEGGDDDEDEGSSGEDERDELDNDEDELSDEKPKKRTNSKRQKYTDEEIHLMELADACRRSGRQRKTVTKYNASSGVEDKPKRGVKRGRGRRQSSSEDGVSGSDGSSDSGGSDYAPTNKRSKRGVRQRRRARISSEFDSDDDERLQRRGAAARGKKIDYTEKRSDEDLDSDDVLEWVDENEGTPEDDTPHETIEKVLKFRIGRKGATGHPTTFYNVEEKNDPNDGFDPTSENEKGEKQYLIKWVGWSHIHNTWESKESLAVLNVKGMKKLENFKKRMKEIEAWKRHVGKDYLECFDCEEQMNDAIHEEYRVVERVVAHQDSRDKNIEGATDYLVKWNCLPYGEATWEDGALLSRWFTAPIEEYWTRQRSKCIPTRLCSALRKRPRFVRIDEQPAYIGGSNESSDTTAVGNRNGGGGRLELRDYQLDGLNWLLQAWCKGNSVILADEMGLGKTIQTIAFLSALYHVHEVYGPFLIVVPLSTMTAWQRECHNWSPQLNLIIYMGDMVSRDMIRQYEWNVVGSKRLKFNCVLTTYEILLKDKAYLGSFDWAVLMVDEAHRLKNDESLLYRSLSEFTTNHRLLITGTPLQNSLKELWALLHFIMPDKFDSWDDFELEHKDMRDFAKLHTQLEPFLLRRIKKDVEKSLPAKIEKILRVDMTALQKQYYKLILTKNYRELSKGVKGSITGFINIVMELKKCCNHCSLVRELDVIASYSEERLQQLLKSSGKLILLHKLLCQLKETGHRVLIFSQMVIMLDVLQEYLQLMRFPYQRIDGTIKGEVRKQALDHFNAEGSQDFCFLLSTRAGGLGINLATADTVIIFDSDWNPQNDLQAQSRAHRIGQKKQVNIYRLVTKGSVEEEIVERAKKKLVLDHLVIQRMDTSGRTVLSKKGATKVPFDKSELSAILKFGAEELFKEQEGEEQEPEVDVENILKMAETRETDESLHPANDLLDAFKVVCYHIDEEKELTQAKNAMAPEEGEIEDEQDWDRIIPEEERKKIAEEERQTAEAELNLGPRQRKKIQQMARHKDSDEDDEDYDPSKKRRRGKGGGATKVAKNSDSSNDDSTDDDDRRTAAAGAKKTALYGFTEAEIRKFVKAFKRFAEPMKRLESIAENAGLEEHGTQDVMRLAQELSRGLNDAQKELNNNEENEEENGKKKIINNASFKLGGADVNARLMLKAQLDLNPLHVAIPQDAIDRRNYKLPGRVKLLKSWDVSWNDADDAALLRGVYQYGMGSWESIKMDPQLSLAEKILPVDKAKKPQAKHLQTRVEYLIKFLAKLHSANVPATSAQKSSKLTTKSTKAESALTKKGVTKRKTKGKPGDSDKEPTKKETKTRLRAEASNSKETATAVDNKKREKKDEPTTLVIRVPTLAEQLKINQKFAGELDDKSSKVFQECVSVMRPVSGLMRRLINAEPGEDIDRLLLKLGDRIYQILLEKKDSSRQKNILEKWHSYLWIFLAQFTQLSEQELLEMYKEASKSRAEQEQKEAGNVSTNADPSSSTGVDAKRKDSHHHHHHHRKRSPSDKHHHHHRSSKHQLKASNEHVDTAGTSMLDKYQNHPSKHSAHPLSGDATSSTSLKSGFNDRHRRRQGDDDGRRSKGDEDRRSSFHHPPSSHRSGAASAAWNSAGRSRNDSSSRNSSETTWRNSSRGGGGNYGNSGKHQQNVKTYNDPPNEHFVFRSANNNSSTNNQYEKTNGSSSSARDPRTAWRK